MAVHIDELSTDVAVESTTAPGEEPASPWEVAAQNRMDQRRAREVHLRTHSEGFDD